jgi:hypothetical protein
MEEQQKQQASADERYNNEYSRLLGEWLLAFGLFCACCVGIGVLFVCRGGFFSPFLRRSRVGPCNHVCMLAWKGRRGSCERRTHLNLADRALSKAPSDPRPCDGCNPTRCCWWVAKGWVSLSPAPGPSWSSSLFLLHLRRGDCQEHRAHGRQVADHPRH